MSTTVQELVESRAALELEDRRSILDREIAQIKERLAARGMLSSGFIVTAIRDAVRQEARVRAALVWNTLARALTSAREILTASAAQEVKDFIARVVREHSSDLQGHLDFTAKLGLPGIGVDPLGDALKAAFDRINSEVDFALLASAGAASDTAPQVVNIYQSQGIVQTGFQASASMVININAEERREINVALSAAREALERDTSLPDGEKRQAIELLDETAAEVEKEQPNRLKIRSGLQGVATTIQMLAAAPQAYNLLKGAAALVGVDLP